MARGCWVSLLFTVLLPLNAPAAEPPSVGVEGKVLDSSTRQPVEGARIVLIRMDRGAVLLGGQMWDDAVEDDPAAVKQRTITGSDGVFRFRIESPASFQLTIQCQGYVNAQVGNFRSIRVEAGESKNDIVVQLHPQGTIRGRVIDADTRQPAVGLMVSAWHYRELGGSRMFGPASSPATTDEEGRYALENLPPGHFYLEVRQSGNAPIGDPTPVEDFLHAEQTGYGTYWYPGVEAFGQSVPVALVGGGTVEGIDIPITKRRVASIRGRVVGDENAGEVQVSLARVEIRVGSRSFRRIARGTRAINSEFQIDGLLPGTYNLTASATTEDLVETRFATLKFQLGDENMDGLGLHLLSGTTVNGRVSIQGREPEPGQPVLPTDNLTVTLDWPTGGGSTIPPGPTPVRAEDGSVVFESVHPDDYLVRAGHLPPGYKLSEVRYNGSLALYNLVTIDPEAREHRLEMTLAPASGSVQVTATTGFRPAAGATVILAPDTVDESTPIELLIHLFTRAATDEDGRATMGSLLPGVYRVIVYPDGTIWEDDPYLVRRVMSGQEVKVGDDAPTLIQVRTEDVR